MPSFAIPFMGKTKRHAQVRKDRRCIAAFQAENRPPMPASDLSRGFPARIFAFRNLEAREHRQACAPSFSADTTSRSAFADFESQAVQFPARYPLILLIAY